MRVDQRRAVQENTRICHLFVRTINKINLHGHGTYVHAMPISMGLRAFTVKELQKLSKKFDIILIIYVQRYIKNI